MTRILVLVPDARALDAAAIARAPGVSAVTVYVPDGAPKARTG
jgi:hypothetical protein